MLAPVYLVPLNIYPHIDYLPFGATNDIKVQCNRGTSREVSKAISLSSSFLLTLATISDWNDLIIHGS